MWRTPFIERLHNGPPICCDGGMETLMELRRQPPQGRDPLPGVHVVAPLHKPLAALDVLL